MIKSKSLDHIETLVITHAHDDHIGGLSAFIEYKRYVQQNTNFTIYAGSYFMEHYKNLAVSKNYYGSIYDFTYKEISDDMSIKIKDVGFEFHKVKHCNWNIETYAIVLTGEKNKIFISSDVDADYVKNLQYHIQTCKLSFIDMGWTGLKPVKEQVHPSENDVYKNGFQDDNKKIIGIHCNELNYYKKAEVGDTYDF